MKKILFSIMAVAAMLTTSCVKGLEDNSAAGQETTVTFSVATPEIATRAFSDGTTATGLQYAVYDAQGNHLPKLDGETTINISTTVELQLTTGNSYSVIFWAAAPSAPYTVDFPSKTMTVDYEGAKSNDEARDAFYAYHSFTVNGAQTETVKLYRPFAQLNIGTSDYAAAADAGYTPTTSSVKVTSIYSTLDLATGDVADETAITFASNAIPTAETFPVSGNEYIAMNYLLVAADKELVDVEFTYSDAAANAKTRTVGSVPVQRNYRTNIYGQLLTSDVDINVEIVPVYNEPAYTPLVWDGTSMAEPKFDQTTGTYTVSTPAELAYIAALVNGTLPADDATRANLPADNLAGKTVVLSNDLDLNNMPWTPIGFCGERTKTTDPAFAGTFDGKGFTISNLKIDVQDCGGVGLFGGVYNATFQNFTLKNVDIKAVESESDPSDISGSASGDGDYIAAGHIGAVAGYEVKGGLVTFENINVEGLIKIEGETRAKQGQRVAGVFGGKALGKVAFTNVKVIGDQGSYIKGYCSTAGIMGQNGAASTFTNVHTDIDVTCYSFGAAGLVGIACQGSVFENCSSAGNISRIQPLAYSSNSFYRLGGIAGCSSIASAKQTLTLKNCSYTGTLTSLNEDGSTLSLYDYDGYVGRSYSYGTATVGSIITIDGVEYKQLDAAGAYQIGNKATYAQVATTDQLNAALNTDAEEIIINLVADVEIAGECYREYGSAATKRIVIKGNSNTLTYKDSYRTYIKLANPEAVLVAENLNLSRQTTNKDTHYHNNNMSFYCNTELTNVAFDKGIILNNASRHTFNNVTITKNKVATSAIFIFAGCELTMDGCTINHAEGVKGRGVKIVDEDMTGEIPSTTLNIANTTFTTADKAAVLMGSKGGAVINWGEGNDISAVAADNVFAVWVDEDWAAYAGKVTVNGALCRVEGPMTSVNSPDELNNAQIENNTTIVLSAGSYVVPAAAKGKTVTFVGAGKPEDVKIAVTKVGSGGENCDYGLDGSTATFENLTLTTNSSTYIGYARCKGTYKNCVINGTYTLYDNSVFENCTFNVSGDVYNLWTWGAPTATFVNCTFNSDGKAVLLYGTANTKLTLEGCIFNDEGGLSDLKAAVEIGNDYNKSYELIVNNTTVNGYEINDKGINTGTTLWANKNSMSQEKLNVVVDGVDVY